MRSLVVLILLFVLAGTARAELVHFIGPHPISPAVMRGMCHIEGPHIHDYIPHKNVLYVQAPDGWAFVGDPTEFEAEIPRYSYYGHHPVFWASAETGQPQERICYISGPHHHWYAPPPETRFVARGGVFWYVGAMPPGYVRRWHRRSPMDDYYGHVHLLVPRPVVTIAPPDGYVGFYFGPGYGRGRYYRGRGYYYGPQVGVTVDVPPPPGVNIVIGGGGGGPVYVGGHGHYKVKGGPPPHAPAHGYRGHAPGHGGGHGGHGGGKGGKWK